MQVQIKRFNKLKYTLKSIKKNPKTTSISIISLSRYNNGEWRSALMRPVKSFKRNVDSNKA